MENTIDKNFVILFGVNSKLAHAVNENKEVQFMSCSIIYSFVGSEWINKITFQLWDCSLEILEIRVSSQGKRSNVTFRWFNNSITPCSECFITKSHWLINWWDFIKPHINFIKPINHGLETRRTHRFSHFATLNRLQTFNHKYCQILTTLTCCILCNMIYINNFPRWKFIGMFYTLEIWLICFWWNCVHLFIIIYIF